MEQIQVLSTTASERQWAAMAHLAALVLALLTSWIVGFAGVIGAGVDRDRHRLVGADHHRLHQGQ